MNMSKIYKSSQWCILSKHHSEIILKDKIHCEELSKCYAPDELVYLTILYVHKNELIITKKATSGATTFTNRSNMDYPYQYHDGLKNYGKITKQEIDYLLKQPCLFGRKFNPDCKVIKNEIPLLNNEEIDQLSQYLTKRIC